MKLLAIILFVGAFAAFISGAYNLGFSAGRKQGWDDAALERRRK